MRRALLNDPARFTAAQLRSIAKNDGWLLKWESGELASDRAKEQIKEVVRRTCEKARLPAGELVVNLKESTTALCVKVCGVLVLSETTAQPLFLHPEFPIAGLSTDDFAAFLRGQDLATS